MSTKWIKFESPVKSASGKTEIWNVWILKDGCSAGVIKWRGGWRKYVFQPHSELLFDAVCLREIADFCDKETRKLRQRWKT